MGEERVELHEKIVLEGAEHAEGGLERIAASAGHLAEKFEAIGEIAGIVGGIGAAWKLAEGLEESNELYASVQRVSEAAGVAAAQAHGLFEAFEKSGIEVETAERVMTQMAKAASKVGGAVSESGKQASELAEMMKSVGVDTKQGLVEQMIQMSEAAQRGKLHLQDLSTLFGVSSRQASHMMFMLKQGPEALRDIFEEVKNSSGVIDEKALESFEEMRKSRAEFAAAWHDFSNTLYKALLPIGSVVLHDIKAAFDAISPIAEHIGGFLQEHMQAVVKLTETWMALLAGNKVANMFGEKKIPLLGGGEGESRLKQLLGLFEATDKHIKVMENHSSRIGDLAKIVPFSRGAAPVVGAGVKAAAGGTEVLAGFAGAAHVAEGAGAAAGAAEGMAGVATAGTSLLSVLGPLALIVGAVVGAFVILKNNTLGIRDTLVATFHGIWSNLKDAFEKLIAIVSKLMEAMKPVIALLGGALLAAVEGISLAIEALAWVIDKVMTAIVGILNAVIWAINKIPKVNIDYIDLDAKKKAEESKRGTAEAKGKDVYQDFRGSKFEIQNNFPTGIDGNRVAVAFGDQLARLGERRLDSGLRPLYSYR